MISVTAAAHSFHRSSRSLGTHLKAYGSGRVAIGNVDEFDVCQPLPKPKPATLLHQLVAKIWHIFLRLIKTICPFVNYLVDVDTLDRKRHRIRNNNYKGSSPFDKLTDDLVLRIVKLVDAKSILDLEQTCWRVRKLIRENNDDLAKIPTDQIKLYFDEGEVIISPVDERKVPVRTCMVPVETLANHLRHLTTSSLFIRGLIPAETIPVLRRLARFRLELNQLYFLWCDFNQDAGDYLKALFLANSTTLSDIGMESCSPARLISDHLIAGNLKNLVSLRVWHDNMGLIYNITDDTLFKLSELFRKGICQLETLDLNSCHISVAGVVALLDGWRESPQRPCLCLSLHGCDFQRVDVVEQSRVQGIPIAHNGVLELEDRTHLTLHVT